MARRKSQIKKIIIGTWPLSGDFGHVSESIVKKTLYKCLDYGFYHFDTAPNYGKGKIETLIGKYLKNKKNIKIDTKFGNSPENGKNFSLISLESSFLNSSKRLKNLKINNLFLHNPRNEKKNYIQIVNFLKKLKKEKKIKNYGLSLAKDYIYTKKVINHFPVLQNDLNLIYLKPLDNINKRKLFYARSPLASGLLSGKINNKTKFKKNDHRSLWLKGSRLVSILKRVNYLKKISDINLPELARAFLLQSSKVDKIIFGVKHPSHVVDIYNSLSNPPLPNSLYNEIKKLYKKDYYLKNEKKHRY